MSDQPPQNTDTPVRLLRALKLLSTLLAISGVTLPGMTFFTEHAPPLFESVGLLTSGIALAVLCLGFMSEVSLQTVRRRVLLWVSIGIVCVGGYDIGRRYTTVVAPHPRSGRVQIGFGRLDFCLKQKGLDLKAAKPYLTAQDWVMRVGGFGQEAKLELLWKSGWIVAAGVLLLLLFITVFVFWTYGFALLAKWIALLMRPLSPVT
ncbi:MAG: hypothetical protein GY778_02080 [bacterium]|nr:hypothetical protein [bacterium]